MLRTYFCVIKFIRNHLPYCIYYLGVLGKTIDMHPNCTQVLCFYWTLYGNMDHSNI